MAKLDYRYTTRWNTHIRIGVLRLAHTFFESNCPCACGCWMSFCRRESNNDRILSTVFIWVFCRDLATAKVGVGGMLLKYSRASTQNGIKMYSSKKMVKWYTINILTNEISIPLSLRFHCIYHFLVQIKSSNKINTFFVCFFIQIHKFFKVFVDGFEGGKCWQYLQPISRMWPSPHLSSSAYHPILDPQVLTEYGIPLLVCWQYPGNSCLEW